MWGLNTEVAVDGVGGEGEVGVVMILLPLPLCKEQTQITSQSIQHDRSNTTHMTTTLPLLPCNSINIMDTRITRILIIDSHEWKMVLSYRYHIGS